MNLNFICVLSFATLPLLQGLFKVFSVLFYGVYSALESSVEFYAMYKGKYKFNPQVMGNQCWDH